MVESVNFVILGRQDIASEFGKKGTATDITTYDRKGAGTIRTWVVPNGFPDKIQPLFEAINLAEYVIFHIDKLDRFAGEQIVALDSLKKDRGIISFTFDVDESKLDAMIKGTVLEKYSKVDQDKVREEADKLKPITADGTPGMIVDHCFDVKGVGTVILGKVTSGKIKQYDNLRLYPAGIDVMIKSIQMHDDAVKEAAAPARVGLAVKGARPEQVRRGDVISQEEETAVRIELDFAKNPFYKEGFARGQGCLVNVGLQTRAAKFSSTEPLGLEFESPIVYKRGQIAVILKPESSTIRILGSGTIL